MIFMVTLIGDEQAILPQYGYFDTRADANNKIARINANARSDGREPMPLTSIAVAHGMD